MGEIKRVKQFKVNKSFTKGERESLVHEDNLKTFHLFSCCTDLQKRAHKSPHDFILYP